MNARYEYRVVNVDGEVEYQTTPQALKNREADHMLLAYAQDAAVRLTLQHDMTVCEVHRIERRLIVGWEPI